VGKFLAILNGAADEADREELTEQQQADFLTAWATWAQVNEHALVDPGAPLYLKKRLTREKVEDFTDAKIAYAVVEAESHDDAVQIFKDHPHLGLTPGNSIEVLQCPAIPS
jgi:hypothetical protein